MINHAMFKVSRDQLNEFTRYIDNRLFAGFAVRVKLRNHSYDTITSRRQEDEDDDYAFFSAGHRHCWRADGSSVACGDYDIVEIEDVDAR
jgi:hypothetical protein